MSGYDCSVDWWSLGVLVYEMVTGLTPWRHHNICALYDMILSSPLCWPNTPGLQEDTRDFVREVQRILTFPLNLSLFFNDFAILKSFGSCHSIRSTLPSAAC